MKTILVYIPRFENRTEIFEALSTFENGKMFTQNIWGVQISEENVNGAKMCIEYALAGLNFTSGKTENYIYFKN